MSYSKTTPHARLRAIDVTFACDTAQFAAADVMTDPCRIPEAVAKAGGTGYIVGVDILDKDDQTAAGMDVYFSSTDTPLGVKNAAISITDANAEKILGRVPISSGDWADLINSKHVTKVPGDVGLPMPIRAEAGQRDVYATLVTAGTGTQTASGIVARIWVQDTVN